MRQHSHTILMSVVLLLSVSGIVRTDDQPSEPQAPGLPSEKAAHGGATSQPSNAGEPIGTKTRASDRGWLGVNVCGDAESGCPVRSVFPNSPAEKAGLKKGDLITTLDGNESRSIREFVQHIGSKKPGDQVTLEIQRGPRTLTQTVVLGRWPDELLAAMNANPGELVGKPVPAFVATDLNGKEVTIADFKGRVVVLDLWATWCGPCVAALPGLQKIAERYADKPVSIIGVNQDVSEAEEKVSAFLKDKGITIRQIRDPQQKLSPIFHVHGIPHMVLIDKDGVIQGFHVGYGLGTEARVEEWIDRLLEGIPIPDAQRDYFRRPERLEPRWTPQPTTQPVDNTP